MDKIQNWYNGTNTPQKILLYLSTLIVGFALGVVTMVPPLFIVGVVAPLAFLLYLHFGAKR